MSDLLKPISSKSVDHINQWSMPDIKSNNTVAAKVHKNKERDKSLRPKKENKQTYESVEEVNDDSDTKITAQQLEKITEEARRDGHDKGYQEGFEKGEKEGKEEGLKQASDSISKQVEQLQMLIDTLLIPIKKEEKELSNKLEGIVTTLVQCITRKELTLNSSVIIDCVNKSLDCIEKNKDPVVLYLNSQDDEVIKEYLENSDWNINYRVDNDLLPGGCRVETEKSTVDFSVEEQINQVLEQIHSADDIPL